jgi:HPt (histidine-containing phosphotransfer) domain-containing protein
MLSRSTETPLLDEPQLELLREALDESDLAAMLSELPAAAQQPIGAIEAAVRSNDMVEARRSAHVLKGVASSFGAARLAAMAREIELESVSIEDVVDCIPDLRATVEQTSNAFPGRVTASPSGATQ